MCLKTAINGPCRILPPQWGNYTFLKRKSKTVIFSMLQTCKSVPYFAHMTTPPAIPANNQPATQQNPAFCGKSIKQKALV